MTYLILIVASILLLVGFAVVTREEGKRGTRVLEPRRAKLDAFVTRIVFIINHVDFAAFIREESRRAAGLLGHTAAYLSLQVVRAAERLLTRVVRKLRTEHAVEPRPVGETREFVKTLSDFKGRLKETMPEMAPVQEQG